MNPPVVSLPITAEASEQSDLAVKETLELLEWPRLCEHLSEFASTTMGAQAARTLRLPASIKASRNALAETVEMAVLDDLSEGGLNFRGVRDIRAVLQRCVKGGVASGEELLSVAETQAAARRLRRQINDPELRPICTALVDGMVTLPDLEKTLRFALEDGGRVADRASDALGGLRRQWQSLRQERRDKLQDLLRRLGSCLQDTVVAERHGRPVLAVKAGAVGQVPGQVHDSSASGSTLFVEPRSVLGLGNKLTEIEARIRDEELRVLTQLSASVAEEAPSLMVVVEVLLQLDLALSRARYGRWLNGLPPRLEAEADAPFRLKGLRHPLLVWQQQRQGGPAVVPISVECPPSCGWGRSPVPTPVAKQSRSKALALQP